MLFERRAQAGLSPELERLVNEGVLALVVVRQARPVLPVRDRQRLLPAAGAAGTCVDNYMYAKRGKLSTR